MNLGKKIKNEIISKPPKAIHCKKALVAGILRGSGVIFDDDGQIGLQFAIPSEQMVMLLSELLRSLFDYEIREIRVDEDKLNKRDKFIVSITGDKVIDILQDLDVLIDNGEEMTVNFKLFGNLTEKECCLSSFLAGLFLSSGNCTIPDNSSSKTGYHLDLAFTHSSPASQTAGELSKRGISSAVIRRRESYVVYIKSAEGIKDFLALIKAFVSVLSITDVMLNRDMSNNVNRQKNCDLANLTKQVEASAKQIGAIDKIERERGLSYLNEDLRKVAVIRRDNPDETLLELAERLNISKSCLNHRLRKIVNIAEGL